MRATKSSVAHIAPGCTAAACTSIASPAAWPSVSLICLKRSRSICSSADVAVARHLVGGVALQQFVEIAPVGQAGQRIVQRIVLDARLGRLEFGVARLGQRLGALELAVELDVGRHVPFGADHLRRLVGLAVDHGARADMADLAVRPAPRDTPTSSVPAVIARFEIALGLRQVVGMDGARPVVVAARPAVGLACRRSR